MARGFESKDIEYQQAESQRPRAQGVPASAEQRASMARRRTLELALARAEADLQAASVVAHRRMLEQAIETLRNRLASD